MDRIGDMRRRARGGEPTASIARAAGVSEPTARKCARMEDLSPEPPKRKDPESELLAPHRETTGSWPGDDCRNWRKQRHTAVRVHARLIDERGCEGSYSTVQRYVKQRREEMARERGRGVTTRGKYLTVTFPHSDVGLTQVFWGETGNTFWSGRASPCGKRGRV